MVNETEAPTNAGTLEVLANEANNFTELEHDFITFMDEYWGRKGEVLTKALAVSEYGFTSEEYESLIKNPKVLVALEERGVNFRNTTMRNLLIEAGEEAPLEAVGWRTKGLTHQQLLCANVMLDLLDTRNDKKKLQDLGIPSRTYNRWLMDPLFSGYLSEKAETLLGHSQHEVSLALIDKVRSGDLKAIQLHMEYTDRFISKSGINGSGGGAIANAEQYDLQSANKIIESIIQIIVEEVSDPQVAANIADRMRNLGQQKALTDAVMNPTGVVNAGSATSNLPVENHSYPQVIENRVLEAPNGSDE